MLSLPFVGTIDPANLAELYEAAAVVDGRSIRIDVNFSTPALEPAAATALASFLADLAGHAASAQRFLEAEYSNPADGTVRDFLAFHLEELPQQMAALVGPGGAASPERALLAKMVVERIGLYPENERDFAVLDFTFEGNAMVDGRRAITDQIIAVYFDRRGTITHLSHES